MSQILRTQLLQLLSTNFSREELRTLCFDLGVNYDDLPAEGRAAKARELIIYLEQRQRLHELVEAGGKMRPNVPWKDVYLEPGGDSTVEQSLEGEDVAVVQVDGPAETPITTQPPSTTIPEVQTPVGQTKPPASVLVLSTPIHIELVRIPAGDLGFAGERSLERDLPGARLPEYYIGKYPVTNAQYAVFVSATKIRAPVHWRRFLRPTRIPPHKEDHPVVNVSWHDAVAFCRWLSRESGMHLRLPTEAEWEKAAYGLDGRSYPWGNEWDPARLNSADAGPGDTTPVGQFSPHGDSPYGVADMLGNVWEWCADWYSPPLSRVQRGSSYYGIRDDIRQGRSGDRPDMTYASLGFRVAGRLTVTSDLPDD